MITNPKIVYILGVSGVAMLVGGWVLLLTANFGLIPYVLCAVGTLDLIMATIFHLQIQKQKQKAAP